MNELRRDLTNSTFARALAFALGAFLLFKLFHLLLLIALGLLLAVGLNPVLHRICRARLPRGSAVALIAMIMIGISTLVVGVLIPNIVEQLSSLVTRWPELKASAFEHLPQGLDAERLANQLTKDLKLPDGSELLNGAYISATAIFEALAAVGLVLVLSLYFLLDETCAYKWILGFFSAPNRAKLEKTADEVSAIVKGYVKGQAITSLLSTLYTFGILSLLNVPAALTLAVLAGLFDILPVLGFFLALFPATLLALTVSPVTAISVVALYLLYHAIESYLITPYVYGSSMRMSSLTVLLALLVAGSLGGVVGAILALPLVASYPVIERIWLAKWIGRDAVERHNPPGSPA